MKLYVLYNSLNENIIAISEEKEYVYRYIMQNDYSSDLYKVSRIKKQDIINRLMIVYDDLILYECEDVILTAIEMRMINRSIDEQQAKVEDTIDNLNMMLTEYNFSDKDKAVIKKAVKILEKNIKPKNISWFLNIKNFIRDLFTPQKRYIVDCFKEEIYLKDNKYYIHINISDD